MDTGYETPLLRALKAYGANVVESLERFVDDEQLYQECLEQFMEDETFDVLEASLARGDYEEAFASAHTLKGVAGNLGLTPMYEDIYVLVETLRDHSNVALDEKLRAVLAQRNAVRALLIQSGSRI